MIRDARLLVAELKIEKSFLDDMLDEPSHAAIVRSIIELGHNLILRVVAEGVEEPVDLDLLGLIGWEADHGFHIARPKPIAKPVDRLQRAQVLSTPASSESLWSHPLDGLRMFVGLVASASRRA